MAALPTMDGTDNMLVAAAGPTTNVNNTSEDAPSMAAPSMAAHRWDNPNRRGSHRTTNRPVLFLEGVRPRGR